jgi:hypothetical protein
MGAYIFAAIFFGAASFAWSIFQHPGVSRELLFNSAGIGAFRGLIFSMLTVSLLLRARLGAAIGQRPP